MALKSVFVPDYQYLLAFAACSTGVELLFDSASSR